MLLLPKINTVSSLSIRNYTLSALPWLRQANTTWYLTGEAFSWDRFKSCASLLGVFNMEYAWSMWVVEGSRESCPWTQEVL